MPRSTRTSDLLACLGLVVLCLASFGPVLAGRLLLPAEGLFLVDPVFAQHRPASVSPWQNTLLVADLDGVIYPWRHYAASAVAAGRIPLWNPYSACGMPLLANDQSAVLNPTNLVLNWLLSPPIAQSAFALLALLVAALSAYGFARSLGAVPVGAFLAGLTYGLSGFIFIWLGYPLAAAAALLPLLLWTTHRFGRRPSFIGAGLIGTVVAWQFLSGHLSTSVQTLAFWAVFAVYEVVRLRASSPPGWALRYAGMLALAVVLGVGIGSAQLFPTKEYCDNSTLATTGRSCYSGASVGESMRHSITGELAFVRTIARGEAMLLFNPEAHGNPAFQDYRQYPGYGNYAERTSYPGMLALLALVGGLLRWPAPGHRRFFLIAGWCVFAILLHLPVFNTAIYLPVLRLTSSQRMRFVFSLCAAASLGLAASDWLSGRDARRNRRLLWALAALLCLSSAVTVRALMFVGPHLGEIPAELRALRILKLVAPVVAAVMLVTVLLLAQRGRMPQRTLAPALVAIAILDLLVFGARWHALSDPKLSYPMLPEIQSMLAASDGARISGTAVMFRPNLSVVYRCYDSRAYDPIAVARYMALVEAAHGIAPGSDPLVLLGGAEPSRLLDRLTSVGVRWQSDGRGLVEAVPVEGSTPRACVAADVLTCSRKAALDAVLAISDPWRQTVIETHPTWGAAAKRIRPAAITSATPGLVTVRANTEMPGWLVLTDAYFPGWRASVNGREAPIAPANYAFRAVPIPAGDSTITFTYDPASYRIGLFLSCLSLCVVGALLAAGAARSHHWTRSAG